MTKENTDDEQCPVTYKDIHHAINEVYKKVGYVQKKGVIEINSKNKYKVATESEFIAAIRPELAAAGIYQQPLGVVVISNERIESEKTWEGRVTKTYQHRVVIQSTYRFTHVGSNTHVDVVAIGEGMDSGDKSFYKAMTGANKYAMRQLFMIETGDDPDKYASDENGGVLPAKKESAASVNRKYKAFTEDLSKAESPSQFWSERQADITDFLNFEEPESALRTLLDVATKRLESLIADSNDPAEVWGDEGLMIGTIKANYKAGHDRLVAAGKKRKQELEQIEIMKEQLGGVK